MRGEASRSNRGISICVWWNVSFVNERRARNFRLKTIHLHGLCCGRFYNSIGQFLFGDEPLVHYAAKRRTAKWQNHSTLIGGQLIGSYLSSGKPCRVSGTRRGAMALVKWRATLTSSQSHQRAVVVFFKANACQASGTRVINH